jgi:hypothetical protein
VSKEKSIYHVTRPQVKTVKNKEELYLSILKEFADEYDIIGCYPAITKEEIADRLNPIAKKIYKILDKLERGNG